MQIQNKAPPNGPVGLFFFLKCLLLLRLLRAVRSSDALPGRPIQAADEGGAVTQLFSLFPRNAQRSVCGDSSGREGDAVQSGCRSRHLNFCNFGEPR